MQYKESESNSLKEITSKISSEIISSIYSLYLENQKTKDFFSIVIPIPDISFFCPEETGLPYKRSQCMAKLALSHAVDFKARKIRGIKEVRSDPRTTNIQGFEYNFYLLEMIRHKGDPIQILVTCCPEEDTSYVLEAIHKRTHLRDTKIAPKKSIQRHSNCIYTPLITSMIEYNPTIEHIREKTEEIYASVEKFFKLNPIRRTINIRIIVPEDQMPYSLMRKLTSGYSVHPDRVITQYILDIQTSIRASNCKRGGKFDIKYGTSSCGHLIKMPAVSFNLEHRPKKKVKFTVEITSGTSCEKCNKYMKKKIPDYLIFDLT